MTEPATVNNTEQNAETSPFASTLSGIFAKSFLLSRKAIRLLQEDVQKRREQVRAEALQCINRILAPDMSLEQQFTDAVGQLSRMLSVIDTSVRKIDTTIKANWMDDVPDSEISIISIPTMVRWNEAMNRVLGEYETFNHNVCAIKTKIEMRNREIESKKPEQ